MSETNSPGPETAGRSALAKCEKHGLHYDPAKMTGCVICRREERAALGAPAPTAAVSAAGAVSAARAGRSTLVPWLVAAVLCLAAGLIFDRYGERMTERIFGKPEDVLQAPSSSPRSKQMDGVLRELAGGTP